MLKEDPLCFFSIIKAIFDPFSIIGQLIYSFFVIFSEPVSHSKGRFKLNKDTSGQIVKLTKLSNFIREKVATRTIPHLDPIQHGQPKVLIKMDIEGSEVEVIPNLIYSQSFDFIDVILIEFHNFLNQKKRKVESDWLRFFTQDYAFLYNLVQNRSIEIFDFDDESYHLSNYSLPKC